MIKNVFRLHREKKYSFTTNQSYKFSPTYKTVFTDLAKMYDTQSKIVDIFMTF